MPTPRKKPAKKAAKKKPTRTPARRPRLKAPPVGPRGLKFGPEARKAVTSALARGATQKLAAEFAGVDPRTLKTWLARGRDNLAEFAEWEQGGELGDEPQLDAYGRFVLEVAQAKARADFELVGYMHDAAERGEWRAALALLARRRPSEFGEHLSVSASAVDESTEQRVDVTDDLLGKLALVARRVRGEGDEVDGQADEVDGASG